MSWRIGRLCFLKTSCGRTMLPHCYSSSTSTSAKSARKLPPLLDRRRFHPDWSIPALSYDSCWLLFEVAMCGWCIWTRLIAPSHELCHRRPAATLSFLLRCLRHFLLFAFSCWGLFCFAWIALEPIMMFTLYRSEEVMMLLEPLLHEATVANACHRLQPVRRTHSSCLRLADRLVCQGLNRPPHAPHCPLSLLGSALFRHRFPNLFHSSLLNCISSVSRQSNRCLLIETQAAWGRNPSALAHQSSLLPILWYYFLITFSLTNVSKSSSSLIRWCKSRRLKFSEQSAFCFFPSTMPILSSVEFGDRMSTARPSELSPLATFGFIARSLSTSSRGCYLCPTISLDWR